MRFIIYCDESASKGKFYSNFYGGAIILSNKREEIEAKLIASKGILQGEAKWTKISEYN